MILSSRFSSAKDELMHVVISLYELSIYDVHKQELEDHYGKDMVEEVENDLKSLILRLN